MFFLRLGIYLHMVEHIFLNLVLSVATITDLLNLAFDPVSVKHMVDIE